MERHGIGMGDSAKTEGKKKPSFFKGLKKELKKVIWPDRKTVTKQTAAVVVVSVALGLLIALMDFIIQYGVDWLVTF